MLMSVDYEKEHGADSRNGLPRFLYARKGEADGERVCDEHLHRHQRRAKQSRAIAAESERGENEPDSLLDMRQDEQKGQEDSEKGSADGLSRQTRMDHLCRRQAEDGQQRGHQLHHSAQGRSRNRRRQAVLRKGGAHGWKSVGRKYRIHAKIVKSGESTLPPTLADQGGNPPFRNYSAPTLHNAAFTRTTDARLPIVPVSGLAVPQMPLNLSRERVEDDILAALSDQLDYYVNRYIFS